jgi:hypothetical protein
VNGNVWYAEYCKKRGLGECFSPSVLSARDVGIPPAE